MRIHSLAHFCFVVCSDFLIIIFNLYFMHHFLIVARGLIYIIQLVCEATGDRQTELTAHCPKPLFRPGDEWPHLR
jgi:hypothetical protein